MEKNRNECMQMSNLFMRIDNGPAMLALATSDYHHIYDPLNGLACAMLRVLGT